MFSLMNRLDTQTRARILSMLVEGSSLRSITRVCDVSINTVTKLLVDAGKVALAYHDQNVRGLKTKRVQCDEIFLNRRFRPPRVTLRGETREANKVSPSGS